MSSRDKFFEILSSLSSSVVNETLFEVSNPIAVDGTKTAVYLKPYGISNLYGGRTIEYTRFNLSDVPPVTLQSRSEQYAHELVVRLKRYNIFKYRINDPKQPGVTKTRFLTLAERDIVSDVVPRVFSQPVKVTLRATDISDFFVGSMEVTLTPVI